MQEKCDCGTDQPHILKCRGQAPNFHVLLGLVGNQITILISNSVHMPIIHVLRCDGKDRVSHQI